jgi:hypothetical protein
MFEIRNNAYNVDFCIPENPKSSKTMLVHERKKNKNFF